MLKEIANWGRYPVQHSKELYFREAKEAAGILQQESSLIARGNGRCYGDASLAATVLSTLKCNKILQFDRVRGIMDCQAGITLEELLKIIVPAGWFLPVTPGTKLITVGGAVASDVHGKNHHKEGAFCQYVEVLDLITATGEVVSCGPTLNRPLFEVTCGGMGLSGIIIRVRFKLKAIKTAYIKQTQYKAANLQEAFALFEKHREVTYSVAWIDCLQQGKALGRSILMLGEHADVEELPRDLQEEPLKVPVKKKLSIPFDFPAFALNPYSVRAFNFAYYHKLRKQQQSNVIDYDTYFYPLDFVGHWNRMYGSRGFVQYQFVLPLETSLEGLSTILKKIGDKGFGSFLAVLKLFGKQDSLISFPMEGYTLALDFALNPALFSFLDELDEIVHALGGRIYLSKDARMKPEMFYKGYPGAETFIRQIQTMDPLQKFSSLQSKRLGIQA